MSSKPSGGDSAGGDVHVAPRAFLTRVRRADGLLGVCELFVLRLIMMALVALLATQVVSRYVSPVPLFWVEEIARLLLVWLTFLGCAYVTHRGAHLQIAGFFSLLTTRSKRFVGAVTNASIAVVSFFLAWASVGLVLSLYNISLAASGLSRSLLFLAVAVGMTLTALHASTRIILEETTPQTTKSVVPQ